MLLSDTAYRIHLAESGHGMILASEIEAECFELDRDDAVQVAEWFKQNYKLERIVK